MYGLNIYTIKSCIVFTMKKNILIIGLVLLALIAFTGCASTIEDVKVEENVDDKVTLQGTAKAPLKIGDLSGYTLVDETGAIPVATDNPPEEGEEVTVRGTLKKELLIGYYVKVE